MSIHLHCHNSLCVVSKVSHRRKRHQLEVSRLKNLTLAKFSANREEQLRGDVAIKGLRLVEGARTKSVYDGPEINYR